MARYKLPESFGILADEVIEAEYLWSGCAGAKHEYNMVGGIQIWASQPFEEVPPPIPDEPKAEVGRLDYFVDRYGLGWQNSIHKPGWHSAGGKNRSWRALWDEAGPLVRLVPDPAHGVTS